MVQTFGKRVLGGIGAPGGGMSTAYAEGVNVGINQRSNRQAMSAVDQEMRMREQDQQFKIEDREEAKRQRAAAAAAAGAARARSAALAKALAGGVSAGPAPGLKIPPGQTYGPRVAVGGPIPATPPAARPTLPQVTPSAPLSFGLGAAGQQVSQAPDMNISNIEFVRGTYDTVPVGGGRAGVQTGAGPRVRPNIPSTYGVSATVAPPVAPTPPLAGTNTSMLPYTEGPLPSYVDPAGLWSSIAGEIPGAAQAEALFREGWINEYEYQQLVRGSRGQQSEVLTNAARRQSGTNIPFFDPTTATTAAPTAATTAAPTAATTAATGAPTGPAAMQGPPVAPTVTIQGPNGPIVLPIEEAYPTGNIYGAEPTQAQLSFGPALGAVGADQNATAVDRVAANPVGQAQPTPNAERYIMEPGLPGRELQQAYDTRAELARQIDIYAEYGDYAAVRDLTTKVNELDNTLYYLQGMQGIQELQFNSPQRLQMVLSEELGRDIGLQPNAQGGYDIYVDGMLALQKDAGGGENSISYWARSIIDDNFATAEATRAAEYGKLAYESQLNREETMVQGQVNAELAQQKAALERESARIAGLTELDMMAIKRDLGLTNDDKLQFEKDETSGFILVFRNGEFEAQYGPAEDTSGNVVGFEQKY
jgi:hypothetical protein